jgi:hypothetical protein
MVGLASHGDANLTSGRIKSTSKLTYGPLFYSVLVSKDDAHRASNGRTKAIERKERPVSGCSSLS